MKRFRNFSLLAVACVTGAPAAQIQGFLIDKACEQRIVQGGQPEAAAHTRECSQMNACERSGYFLYTPDNKVLTLDAAGNAKAIAALKSTSKKDNVKVEISGEIEGSAIKVASVKLL